MAKDEKSLSRKKYEPPSLTGPEPAFKRQAGFVPLGATACSFGDIGSACAPGTEPQGGPSKCSVGNQPDILNCSTGTTAGEECVSGTDAIVNCNIGTAVLADCMKGNSPVGPGCSRGLNAAVCSAGSSPG